MPLFGLFKPDFCQNKSTQDSKVVMLTLTNREVKSMDIAKMRKKIFSGIGILVLLFIIFSAACQSDNKSESAPTSSAAKATPATTTTPDLTVVDLTAFIGEFDASETAALNKYKGKYVQLSGYVNKFKAASAAGSFAVIVPNQGVAL